MPIHDWTRVGHWVFHDFRLSWIVLISGRLNNGILPAGYYSMLVYPGERVGPDLYIDDDPAPGVWSAPENPPAVRFTLPLDEKYNPPPPRTLGIYQHDDEGQRLVGQIEVVSPSHKASRRNLERLIRPTLDALEQGRHVALLDLHPPTPRDPHGIHGAIWAELGDESYRQPPGKPLTLTSYIGGLAKTAYVEPLAAGDRLPDMPLFLSMSDYVLVPLEETYAEAINGMAECLRVMLEAPRP